MDSSQEVRKEMHHQWESLFKMKVLIKDIATKLISAGIKIAQTNSNQEPPIITAPDSTTSITSTSITTQNNLAANWEFLLTEKLPKWQASYTKALKELRAEAAMLGINGIVEAIHILNVQKKLTEGFQSILQEMLHEAQSLIGEAPCPFGWFGVGSYSRGEVLPYSDVECLWLFEEEKIETRRYFHFLNELINLQIESVGEQKNGGFHHDDYVEVKEIESAEGKKETLPKTLDEITQTFVSNSNSLAYAEVVSSLQGKLIAGDNYFWKRYVEKMKGYLQENTRGNKSNIEISPFALTCRKILYESVFNFEKTWLKTPTSSEENPQEDVKKGYAFFLTYLAILLKYYHNAEGESSVEIFENLKQRKILSDSLAQSLIQAWKEMQALRYRTQVYYKRGAHRFARSLISLNSTSASSAFTKIIKTTTAFIEEPFEKMYVLSELEEKTFNHILENVLKPIYEHLSAIKAIDANIKSKAQKKKTLSESKPSHEETTTSSEVELKHRAESHDIWHLLSQHQNSYLKISPALIFPGASKEGFQHALQQCLRQPRGELLQAVKLLTSLGARGDVPDTLQLTPMRQVLSWSEKNIILAKSIWEILLRAKGDTEERQESYPLTLLEQAMREEKYESVILLCELGAGRHAQVQVLLSFIEQPGTNTKQETLLKTFREKCIPILIQQNHHLAWRISLLFLKQEIEPNATPLVILEGSRSGKGYLTLDISKQLFKQGTKIVGENEYGRRNVLKLTIKNQGIFAKIYPELPGIEEAIRVLANQLFGFVVPESELFRFDEQGKTTKSYPVLLSQEVKGINFQDVLKRAYIEKDSKAQEVLRKIDSYQFSQLFLLSILIHPEDGKPDNYILTPIKNNAGEDVYAIVGIDNDHAFVDGFTSEKGQAKLQIKTVIYCLDQMMQSLHPKTIKEFLQFEIKAEIETWLNNLISSQKNYEILFPIEIRQALLKKESVTQIPLPPGAITKLYERWIRLKNNLQKYPYFSALQILIRTEPMIGLAYQAVWDKHQEPLARFHEIASSAYFFTPQKGQYKTLITSRQLLKTQKIVEKTLIFGNGLGPLEAMEEMRRLLAEQTNIQKWVSELNNKNISSFKVIQLNSVKQAVLKGVDFSTWSSEEQSQLIKILLSERDGLEGIEELYLNGLNFTMPQLEKLLNRQAGLTKLIINHSLLDDTFSSLLLKHIETLEVLSLSYCDNLINFSVIISFLRLKALTLNNLPNLKIVKLSAPLKQLELTRLAANLYIETTQLTTINLKQAIIPVPELTDLIKNNPNLKFENMLCDNPATQQSLALFFAKQNKWSEEVLRVFLSTTTLDLSSFSFDSEKIWAIIPHATTLKIQSFSVKEDFPLYLMGPISFIPSLQTLTHGIRSFPFSELRNLKNNFLLKIKGLSISLHIVDSHQKILLSVVKKILNVEDVKWKAASPQTLLTQLIFLWSLKPILVEWIDFEKSKLSHTHIQQLLHFNISLRITSKFWSYASFALYLKNTKENSLTSIINDTEALNLSLASPLTTLTCLPNHQIAIGDTKGVVHLFSSDSYQTLQSFSVEGAVFCLTFQKDKLLAVSKHGTVSLWDRKMRNILHSWQGRLPINAGSYAVCYSQQFILPVHDLVPKNFTQALLRATKDMHWSVRASAIESLGKMGQATPQIIGALLLAMRDLERYVRQKAAEALGVLGQGTPQIIDALLNAIKDKDWPVRRNASEALGKLGRATPKVIAALLEAKEDVEWGVRVSAVKALSALGKKTTQIIEGLIEAIGDSNEEVRRAAIEALETLEHPLPEITPHVIETEKNAEGNVKIMRAKVSDELVQPMVQEIIVGLGKLDGSITPEIIDVLMGAMKNADFIVRNKANETLGEVFHCSPNVISFWDSHQNVSGHLRSHTDNINAISLLDEARLVSASKDKTLKLWDLEKKVCLKTFEGHMDSITCVLPISNKIIASGSEDKSIILWDVRTGKPLKTMAGHNAGITTILTLSKQKLLSASKDKMLKIWDIQTGTCISTLDVKPVITHFALLPHGEVAMLGKGESIVRVAHIEKPFSINVEELRNTLGSQFKLKIDKDACFLSIHLSLDYEKEIKPCLKTFEYFFNGLGIVGEFEYDFSNASLKITFYEKSFLETAAMLLEALNIQLKRASFEKIKEIKPILKKEVTKVPTKTNQSKPDNILASSSLIIPTLNNMPEKKIIILPAKKSTFFQDTNHKTLFKTFQMQVLKLVQNGWMELSEIETFYALPKTSFEKEIFLETLEWIKTYLMAEEEKLLWVTQQLDLRAQFIQIGKKPKAWNKEIVQLLVDYAHYIKICLENSSESTTRQNLHLLSDECWICAFIIKALLQGQHKKSKEEKSFKQLVVSDEKLFLKELTASPIESQFNIKLYEESLSCLKGISSAQDLWKDINISVDALLPEELIQSQQNLKYDITEQQKRYQQILAFGKKEVKTAWKFFFLTKQSLPIEKSAGHKGKTITALFHLNKPFTSNRLAFFNSISSSALGSTYFGVEKSLDLETTLCLDANYQAPGCGATADGYGHFDDIKLNQRIQRAAYRTAQLAVRYAMCYPDAESLFQDLPDLMRQVGKSMKNSFMHPEASATASCVLTRVFPEANGTHMTVIAAGLGDGMVMSFDPKTHQLHTLIQPRQYDRGEQYTPISVTENFKEGMLQTCKKALSIGSILIRMTDGAWRALPYRVSSRQVDAQTQHAYLSYTLDTHKLLPELINFSEDYSDADAATIRQFLLQLIQQSVERDRYFLQTYFEQLVVCYQNYLSEASHHAAKPISAFVKEMEERVSGFKKNFERFLALLSYPLEKTLALALKDFELHKLKIAIGDDLALNVEIIGISSIALNNTNDPLPSKYYYE